jgi:hypothetical protein
VRGYAEFAPCETKAQATPTLPGSTTAQQRAVSGGARQAADRSAKPFFGETICRTNTSNEDE